jgi:hypothetical protein
LLRFFGRDQRNRVTHVHIGRSFLPPLGPEVVEHGLIGEFARPT